MRAIDTCHWNHLNTANTRLAGTEVRALECRWGGSRSAGCGAFTHDKLEAAVVARFPRSWWEYAFRGTRSGILPGLVGVGVVLQCFPSVGFIVFVVVKLLGMTHNPL